MIQCGHLLVAGALANMDDIPVRSGFLGKTMVELLYLPKHSCEKVHCVDILKPTRKHFVNISSTIIASRWFEKKTDGSLDGMDKRETSEKHVPIKPKHVCCFFDLLMWKTDDKMVQGFINNTLPISSIIKNVEEKKRTQTISRPTVFLAKMSLYNVIRSTSGR